MYAVRARRGVGHLTGELEGLREQEGAGLGRVRAREGAVCALDLVEQGVLGLRAEGRGRLWGV
jgi:hypothetical protein